MSTARHLRKRQRLQNHGIDTLYMAVDTEHGAAYGNTLSWSAKDKPKLPVRQVEVLLDLDNDRFNRMFVDLMRAPTPAAAPKTD